VEPTRWSRTGIANIDGFVKSPSVPRGAGLRFILALLHSRCARPGRRFNRVNHCGVRLCTPQSSRFIRLWRIYPPLEDLSASGGFIRPWRIYPPLEDLSAPGGFTRLAQPGAGELAPSNLATSYEVININIDCGRYTHELVFLFPSSAKKFPLRKLDDWAISS
jgi:hypothetical protein